jgi:hypothetical protein
MARGVRESSEIEQMLAPPQEDCNQVDAYRSFTSTS